jgi:two-component system cell cycle sensor histidine kinase/response regulator CckA
VLVWMATLLVVATLLSALAWFARRSRRLSKRVADLQREIGVRECIERQLQAIQSNLQMATEASGVGTWYWDLQTDEVTSSDQAARLFGLETDSRTFKSSDWLSLTHPDDVDRVKSVVAGASSAGEIYHVEYRVARPDGKTVWLSTSGRALRDSDGTVRRMAGITTDVTDRKRLEENFYQAQKMEAVGRLAGGVAHDFNNMLGVISAYAELLREDAGLPKSSAKRVTEILNAVQRANALTRQLLAFSRKQVINPTSLDLNAVILGVKDMLQRLLGEDVRISTNLAEKLPNITADRGLLEQVLLNFAANSRDAMPKSGHFELKTSMRATPAQGTRDSSEEFVVLDVSDTGCGMSPEVMKHVFEPFFTTKDPSRGTGLGLATVYGVIEQLQGKVTVDSTVGVGTTFHIHLPSVESKVAGEPTPPTAPETAPAATILLVEDESSLRNVLTEFIEASGMRVLAASGGREALARIDAGERIDVLLTDLVMPGLDGRSLAQIARAKMPSLHVIYMSGHTDDTLIQKESLEAGLFYLQKPFSRADLVKAIAAAMVPVA